MSPIPCSPPSVPYPLSTPICPLSPVPYPTSHVPCPLPPVHYPLYDILCPISTVCLIIPYRSYVSLSPCVFVISVFFLVSACRARCDRFATPACALRSSGWRAFAACTSSSTPTTWRSSSNTMRGPGTPRSSSSSWSRRVIRSYHVLLLVPRTMYVLVPGTT